MYADHFMCTHAHTHLMDILYRKQFMNQNCRKYKLIISLPLFPQRDHLHRIVYIFEYSKPNEDFELQEVFNNMVSEVNSGYCEEPITGMLIYYKRLGINMIEVRVTVSDLKNKSLAICNINNSSFVYYNYIVYIVGSLI